MKHLTIEIKKETISKTKFKKMKKFLFSAVALVAFSFAGMANNEVKEVEVKETKQVKKLGKCDQLANDVMDAYEANDYTPEEAYEYGLAAYKDCLKG